MKDLKKIAFHLGPYRKDLAIAALLVLVETSFELAIPMLMADIIDIGVEQGDMTLIWNRGVQMAVVLLTAWELKCVRLSTKKFRNIHLPIWITLNLRL